MVSTLRVDSNTSGPLMSTPIWAPRPVPTNSAVGVARPRAQGQAMISTATVAVNAALTGKPAPSHAPSVATATAMATGTNTAETRSASRWISALPDWASSTILAICANCVSEPTRVALTTRRPPAFTVAPVTGSPAVTSTGTDSPVSIDASMAEVPEVITPSVAIFSPGRTTNSSPSDSSSIETRCSAQHRALFGSESHQGTQRCPSLAFGAFLEVAAQQDEGDHPGADFKINMSQPVGAGNCEFEWMHHPGLPGGAKEQGDNRPDQ